jgi:hypothetical protein
LGFHETKKKFKRFYGGKILMETKPPWRREKIYASCCCLCVLGAIAVKPGDIFVRVLGGIVLNRAVLISVKGNITSTDFGEEVAQKKKESEQKQK